MNLAAECVGSGPLGMDSGPMSDAVCAWLSNLFGATSDPQLVAASAGLGLHGKDQAAHQGWLLPALGLEAGQQKLPKHPEIHLQQTPPAC